MQYKSHPEDLTFIARRATDFLVRAACRRSSVLIAISDFSKGEIVKFTGTAPGKIHVTLLAADPSFADPVPSRALRERLGTLLGGRSPYLLVVSNTYPHKNVASAVTAFGRLTGEIPHSLVLLGQPRLGEAEVRSAADALPDPGRLIRLTHVAGREDLRALYQGADVFLFPSLYEGFGLPVLEAMMAGVPVVTTGAASIREVAGDEAVLFDPAGPDGMANALRTVLGWSPEERKQRVAGARGRAHSFSWDRTAEETVAALRKALGT
jgi:alpha-1,3-rhamnosyl/mannosyltransferase